MNYSEAGVRSRNDAAVVLPWACHGRGEGKVELSIEVLTVSPKSLTSIRRYSHRERLLIHPHKSISSGLFDLKRLARRGRQHRNAIVLALNLTDRLKATHCVSQAQCSPVVGLHRRFPSFEANLQTVATAETLSPRYVRGFSRRGERSPLRRAQTDPLLPALSQDR